MSITYRQEIDGLRAIAISSVFLYHAFPQFVPGGFVGVDIFFIISGYLISLGIFIEIDKNEFSFKSFYSRRTRRIFPSLITVLVATYLFGLISLTPMELAWLGRNISSACTFTLNFILQGQTGYFDPAADHSPVLHLWSLCIEEQFYFIFPIIIYIAYKKKVNRFILILSLIIFSFYQDLSYIYTQPTSAFYFPHSRFWELLIGSLLALLHHQKIFIFNNTLSKTTPAIGIGLAFGSVFLINKEMSFPGWITLFPCFAAFAILYSTSKSPASKFLENSVMVWIGKISYPLYLWHYPILSYLKIYHGTTPPIEHVFIAMALSVFLAWATYEYIEKPIRFGKFRYVNPTPVIGTLVLSLIAIGIGGKLTSKFDGLPSRFDIDKILRADQNDYATSKSFNCSETNWGKDASCSISNPNKLPTVALIGDSHAGHFMAGVSDYVESKGGNLITISGAGCVPFIDVRTRPQRNMDEHCKAFIDKAYAFILNNKSISTIVLATRGVISITETTFGDDDALTRHIDSDHYPEAKDSAELFKQSLIRSIEHFEKNKINTVLILDNPELGFNPTICKKLPLIRSSKSPCGVDREAVNSRNEEYRKIVFEVAKESSSTSVVDSFPVFCDNTLCYGERDGHRLYHDSNHLTPYGSKLMIPRYKF